VCIHSEYDNKEVKKMSKMQELSTALDELSTTLDELRNTATSLHKSATILAAMFNEKSDAPAAPEALVMLENVRAVLAENPATGTPPMCAC
jgi:chromosome segregation ATPase